MQKKIYIYFSIFIGDQEVRENYIINYIYYRY